MTLLLFNSKALLSQQKLCDAAVNFICVPKFTAASRGPPCDSVASCLFTLGYRALGYFNLFHFPTVQAFN